MLLYNSDENMDPALSTPGTSQDVAMSDISVTKRKFERNGREVSKSYYYKLKRKEDEASKEQNRIELQAVG